MKLDLTRRVCNDLRPVLRAYADRTVFSQSRYSALRKIAELLDRADDAARGGVSITLALWDDEHLAVLRAILMDVLADCVQMQVRRALVVRINRLDDHLGTSAVERLGRLS